MTTANQPTERRIHTGFSRQLPSGKWQAMYPTGDGKHKSLGQTYDTEHEADHARAVEYVMRSQKLSLGGPIGQYGLLVINDFWRRAKAQGRDPLDDGKRRDHTRWKIIQRSTLGPKNIKSVTRKILKDMQVELLRMTSERTGEEYSNQSIKHTWKLLRRVLLQAAEDGIVPFDLMKDLKPLLRTGEYVLPANPLSVAETHAVLTCPTYTPVQRTAFGLAVYSGLREGELAALNLENVHSVDPAYPCTCTDLDDDAKRDPHIWVKFSWEKPAPKNGQHRRVFLLPPAVDIIQAWLTYRKTWSSRAKRYSRKSPNFWGRKYKRGHDWGWAEKLDNTHGVHWLGARRMAGIRRPITFHEMGRDTFASHLLSGTFGRRWNKSEVSKQIGHSDEYVTGRYAALLDEVTRAAVRETTGLVLPDSQDKAAQQRAQRGELTPQQRLLADSLLSQYEAAARTMSDEQAEELEQLALDLADSILGDDAVSLAQRVAARGRLSLTLGVDLARLMIANAGDVDSANGDQADLSNVTVLRPNTKFRKGKDARRPQSKTQA